MSLSQQYDNNSKLISCWHKISSSATMHQRAAKSSNSILISVEWNPENKSRIFHQASRTSRTRRSSSSSSSHSSSSSLAAASTVEGWTTGASRYGGKEQPAALDGNALQLHDIHDPNGINHRRWVQRRLNNIVPCFPFALEIFDLVWMTLGFSILR